MKDKYIKYIISFNAYKKDETLYWLSQYLKANICKRQLVVLFSNIHVTLHKCYRKCVQL